MGTAKMSRTSDQAEKSDDLIAELARLMAENAQGEGSASSPANDMSTGNGPASASTTAPSDRLRATRGSASLYDADEQPDAQQTSRFAAQTSSDQAVMERPAPTSQLSDQLSPMDERFEEDALAELDPFETSATPTQPDSDRFVETEQPRQVASVPSDPIADLIAAQLEQDNLSVKTPAAKEVPSLYEETDQFAGEQPFPPEDDSFSVSPAMGLGGADRSAPGASRKSNDPLQEIENLIGEAVRVGIPESEVKATAPQVEEPDVNDVSMAAEAAILAAAAATEVRNTDAGVNHDDLHAALAQQSPEPHAEIYADERRVTRPVWHKAIGPAVAGALLLAIGLGLYWVFGADTATNGDVPVLTADSTSVKAEPDTPVSEETVASRSVVFDELSGNTEPGNTEQIVSRDQSADVSGADVSRVITGDTSSEAGLANRKVRTVTVRPDGTIVSAEDTLAGGEVLPVERPNVPALPEGTTNVASEFANEPIITDTPSETALAAPSTTPATAAEIGLTNALAPLVSQTSSAPIPRPRPERAASTSAGFGTNTQPLITNSIGAAPTTNGEAVDLIASLANNSVSNTPSQPVASAPPVINGTQAPAYVQLSSQRSVDGARSSMAEIQRRYSSALAGNVLEIQQVELGDKGTYFRVRMPANSIETANRVCGDVKNAGGDCFVRTN